MSINEVMKVILEVFGEKLSQSSNVNGLNDKLIVCKHGLEYIDTYDKIKNYNLMVLDSKDDIMISDFFADFLKSKGKEMQLKSKEISNKIKDSYIKDYILLKRQAFKKDKISKGKINKELLITRLLNLGKKGRKELQLTDEEIEILENYKLHLKDIRQFDNYSIEDFTEADQIFNIFDPDSYENAMLFESEVLTDKDSKVMDDIIGRVIFLDERLQEKYDLDLILYDSFTGRNLSCNDKDPINMIATFILNNKELLLKDKEIIEEINRRLGFSMLNSDYNNEYFLESMDNDGKQKNGLPGLIILLNKLSLITKSCHNESDFTRLLKLDQAIFQNYRDRLGISCLYNVTLNSFDADKDKDMKEASADYIKFTNKKKDPGVFDMLCGDNGFLKNKSYSIEDNSDERLLKEIIDSNGQFSKLTAKELAEILMEYFYFSSPDNITDENGFKDLSPLIDSVIEQRGKDEDMISEFSHNFYKFKSKQDGKKLD